LSQLWEEERSITSSSTLLISNSKYKPTHMVDALDNAKAAKKRDIPQHSNQIQKSLDPILLSPYRTTLCPIVFPCATIMVGHFPSKKHQKGWSCMLHHGMQWLIIRKFTWSTDGLIGDIKSFTNILIFFAHYALLVMCSSYPFFLIILLVMCVIPFRCIIHATQVEIYMHAWL
jgi:hypothetical protein